MSSFEWREVSVGETGRYVNGLAFKPSDWEAEGRPIVRIQNLTNIEKPFNRTTKRVDPIYVVNPGDLLVSWSATLDAFIWNRETGVLNQHIFKVVPDLSVITKRFLYYGLKRAIDEMVKSEHLHGSTMKHINRAPFLAHRLRVPCLSRQDEIVAEIEKQFSRLDEAVAGLKRVKINLKRYKAAVLKAAVEGRLVPTEAELARREGRNYESGALLLQRIQEARRSQWQGKGKYKEPAAPDTTDLPELSEGWAWVTMPQLGELARGKSKHRPRDDAKLYGGPYPFIQTGDVRRSNGTIRDYTQTYSAMGLTQSRLWPAGSLCITIAANIAETGVLTFDSCFPDSVVGFISALESVTTRYVEVFVRTSKEHLAQFAPATAQKNINLDVLERVAVALPPLAEQHRIIAEVDRRLSIVREVEAEVEANLKRAQGLRQAILGKAFSA